MRKSITLEYVQQQYPKETWTYVFTDRSAEEAICNGGAGIYIKYPRGIEERFCLPTSLYSTNYKAEAEALRAASNHIQNSLHTSTNVVLLSDALSVLQAMQTGRDMELNSLASVLTRLTERHRVVLQWIPSHCNVHGNEAADALAKERTRKNQSTSLPPTLKQRQSKSNRGTYGIKSTHTLTKTTHTILSLAVNK